MCKVILQTKWILLLFLITAYVQNTSAQKKYNLTGVVKDAETNTVIDRATIKVIELPQYNTSTNINGGFNIKLPGGSYTITITYIGYKTITQNIVLNKNLNINTELISNNQLAVVDITSRSNKADKIHNTQMGLDHLSMTQIESVPVLFGERDLVKAIQLLPGVKYSSNGTNGFFVRGGGSDQNLILLDDAVVYNPSHLLGFISTFNADAVKDLDFYKGNLPAQYGGRLSSILDVHSNEGTTDRIGGQGGLGLISAHAEINAPLFNGGSFMLSGRRTYADAFLQASSNKGLNSTILHFYDLNTALKYNINNTNSIHISAYRGSDNIGVQKSFETNWGNGTASLRWNHSFKNGFANTSFIFSDYNYQIENFSVNTGYNIQSQIKSYTLKQDFQFILKRDHNLRIGFNGTNYMLNPGTLKAPVTSEYNSFEIQKRNGMELAAYIADEWQVNNKLRFNYGLRSNTFLLNGPYSLNTYNKAGDVASTIQYGKGKIASAYFMLEPRIAASYSFNNATSVKVSYNRSTQNIHVLSNYASSLPTDLYELTSPVIKPEQADQFSLGYYHSLNKQYDFSVETYYKNLMNQVDYKTGSNLFLNKDAESQIVSGTGRAYGIEFLLKKNQGRLSGWIAYSLSRSERKFNEINDGAYFLSNYDRMHDVTLVASYKVNSRLSFSGTFIYQSGNPITSPGGKYVVDGQTSFYYNKRNNDFMPANNRADIGLTWQNASHKRFRSNWTFNVYDIYNRKNPYTIEYQQSKSNDAKAEAVQVSLLGILPSLAWNFKF